MMKPFTHSIMQSLKPEIIDSLTHEQRVAIENAIDGRAPKEYHPVDIRGVLPLFFIRLYFVFLIGRDRRSVIRRQERTRRKFSRLLFWLMILFIFLIPVALIIFMALYGFKCCLGIDLIPGFHLTDLIPEF